MASDIPYKFIGNTDQQRSVELDVQKTVNWYVVYDPKGVKPQGFAPTPGLLRIKTLNNSNYPMRQLFSYKDLILAFTGNNVYSLDQDYDDNYVGALDTIGGNIVVSNNNDFVFIVDGSFGYVYTIAAGTLAKITDPDFPVFPISCVYFNQFFVAFFADSNLIYVSGANNPTQWDSFNFAKFGPKADVVVGAGVVNNRMLVFGNYQTQLWYPFPQQIGNSSFPYTPDQNNVFEFGCAAAKSIAEGQGKLFWLSSDSNGVGSIKMSDGTQIITVSPPWVDLQIKEYIRTDDAVGFVYKEDGYIFYQLTFIEQNVTWLYKYNDQQLGLGPLIDDWVYLERLGGDCHIANCHTFYFPTANHLVGSRLGPVIYDFSSNYETDDGVAIKHYRIGPPFCLPNYNRFIIDKFELDFQAGVGNSNNPGKIPYAFFKVSYDQSHYFKDLPKEEIGRIGKYQYRITWNKLGITRDFTPMIECYDPVKLYINGCNLRIRECRN